jgi:hypothetical protein
MATKINKKTKNALARKNAEALKAKKKDARLSKGNAAPKAKPGTKGKSIVGQSKKKK